MSGIDFSKMDAMGAGTEGDAPKGKEYKRLSSQAESAKWKEELMKAQLARVKDSELLRAEIIQEARAGAPVETLYEKAIKCIVMMTGDEALAALAKGEGKLLG